MVTIQKGQTMNITIKELSPNDCDLALDLFNFEDADADLISDLQNQAANLYGIYDHKMLSGIIQFIKGKNPLLYLFINPASRKKGIGSKALELFEKTLVSDGMDKLLTTYRTDSLPSKEFARKFGYNRKFSSTYMRYSDAQFDLSDQIINSIRYYQDKDYDIAHELYAKAFHEMRISVGDFPDSVVEQPSSTMRIYWANTSNERLVYLQDGIIVGYAHIDGKEIGSISIRQEYQGQGLGRNFVKYICNTILNEGCKEVYLYCVVGNKARYLYDSLGFQDIYTVEYAIKRLE